MKLNKYELEVLQLMNKGWNLAEDKAGWGATCWLQKESLDNGCSVEHKHISVDTVRALGNCISTRKYSGSKDNPIRQYILTEKGKMMVNI